MSYTDNVANFMGSINELEGINFQDLEAVAPDAIKKVRSQPNSPLESRESSPIRYQNHTSGASLSVPTVSTSATTSSNYVTNGSNGINGYASHTTKNGLNGYSAQNGFDDYSDDEYIDTVDVSNICFEAFFKNSNENLTNFPTFRTMRI